MPTHDDVMLRDAFTELRRMEIKTAPPFGVRRPAVAFGWRQQAAALQAAVLALFVVVTFAVMLNRPAVTTDSLSNWTAPTDFLLQTPQADLLRNVPQFGERSSTR